MDIDQLLDSTFNAFNTTSEMTARYENVCSFVNITHRTNFWGQFFLLLGCACTILQRPVYRVKWKIFKGIALICVCGWIQISIVVFRNLIYCNLCKNRREKEELKYRNIMFKYMRQIDFRHRSFRQRSFRHRFILFTILCCWEGRYNLKYLGGLTIRI